MLLASAFSKKHRHLVHEYVPVLEVEVTRGGAELKHVLVCRKLH